MARTRAIERAARQPSPPSTNGSSQNPILIRGSNSPPSEALPTPGNRRSMRLQSAKEEPQMTVAKRRTKGSRVVKAVEKASKPKPVLKDCLICCTARPVINRAGRGFKTIEGTCEHFQNICNACIGTMINEKIVKRDLDEAVLACDYPECEHVLDYNTVAKLIFKVCRESWNDALLMHHLRNGENYIACLNTECGYYFSIEDCQGKSSKPDHGKKIACPHCDDAICLNCMRPDHGFSPCKTAEEIKSLEEIKKMGAKSCPKCGINIEKNGGCNHMKCRHCKFDFCFGCLVGYSPNMQHAEGCSDRGGIMNDPRNWVRDDGNGDAVILRIARQVQQDIDFPQAIPEPPRRVAAVAPAAPPAPPRRQPVAPPPQAASQAQLAAAAVMPRIHASAWMGNLFALIQQNHLHNRRHHHPNGGHHVRLNAVNMPVQGQAGNAVNMPVQGQAGNGNAGIGIGNGNANAGGGARHLGNTPWYS
ncbi:hypothetical protein BU23DRAFT_561360 [Bimuria novae-zelandiae CBS 107.79]|uniref:RBR-type E3 ubiquitin transferase n=1 Tax=Bimuria novae-zelandiae CBS 107.79 TaxID=1447943 RepID=A0A6A5UJS0_9PLEO|nr:hypothetical protein BU23DRAFT_561360 [Bimuria novae-zelandiae CBS 107.79]